MTRPDPEKTVAPAANSDVATDGNRVRRNLRSRGSQAAIYRGRECLFTRCELQDAAQQCKAQDEQAKRVGKKPGSKRGHRRHEQDADNKQGPIDVVRFQPGSPQACVTYWFMNIGRLESSA